MKRLILDTKIIVVCQSACGSAGITANVSLHDIQKIEPMNNLKDRIILNIYKGLESNTLSNDDLVQIIEVTGSYLNLATISKYALNNKISYNGAKKYRNVKKIFGVRFVIDNQYIALETQKCDKWRKKDVCFYKKSFTFASPQCT